MFRIGLVSHSPYLRGGAEQMLLNLTFLLKKNSNMYPVMFIPITTSDNSLREKAEEADIECINIPLSPLYIYQNRTENEAWGEFSRSICNHIEVFKHILLEHNIDLLINNTLTNLVPVFNAFELGIPLINWIHGILDSYLISSHDSYYRLLTDKVIVQLSSKIVCCSYWTEKFYSKYTGCEEKIVTIHNWFDSNGTIMDFNMDSSTFICCNRMEKQKGIITLIKACEILRDRGYYFNLYLYGKGPELNSVKQKIKESFLEDYIKIMKPYNSVSKVYKNILSLIQPSYIESFGMTIIEAMAHRRPVIAAKSGGPQEIIEEGVSGLLCKVNDSIQLAEKMAYLLDNKDEARIMGEKGYLRYKEKFSGAVAGENFSQIIEDTIKNFNGYSPEQYLIYDLLSLVHNKRLPLYNTINDIDGEDENSDENRKKNDKKDSLSNNQEILGIYRKYNNNMLKYEIFVPLEPLKSLIVYVDTHYKNCYGIIKMILQTDENKILRTSEFDLCSIMGKSKIKFEFTPVFNSKNKRFIVKFLFDYKENSSKLSIYEYKKNTFPGHITDLFRVNTNLYYEVD